MQGFPVQRFSLLSFCLRTNEAFVKDCTLINCYSVKKFSGQEQEGRNLIVSLLSACGGLIVLLFLAMKQFNNVTIFPFSRSCSDGQKLEFPMLGS